MCRHHMWRLDLSKRTVETDVNGSCQADIKCPLRWKKHDKSSCVVEKDGQRNENWLCSRSLV